MIFIDMEGKKPDEAWIKKSDALTKEMIRLHEAGDVSGRNKLIDDNSDHWGEIKKWLSELSHGKCWFSEAKDIYSHLDVEHFRPKKEAKDLDGTPRDGYWWLAFDYRNYRLCGNVGNRKKGGWFPLQEGSIRSTYDNPREESEDPYLLDPTNPLDAELLVCDVDGSIRPSNPNVESWDHRRASETIKRLKLNEHAQLADERRRIWQNAKVMINQYRSALSRSVRGGNPAARQEACDAARYLKGMTKPESELSSVARHCIRSFAIKYPELLGLI